MNAIILFLITIMKLPKVFINIITDIIPDLAQKTKRINKQTENVRIQM